MRILARWIVRMMTIIRITNAALIVAVYLDFDVIVSGWCRHFGLRDLFLEKVSVCFWDKRSLTAYLYFCGMSCGSIPIYLYWSAVWIALCAGRTGLLCYNNRSCERLSGNGKGLGLILFASFDAVFLLCSSSFISRSKWISKERKYLAVLELILSIGNSDVSMNVLWSTRTLSPFSSYNLPFSTNQLRTFVSKIDIWILSKIDKSLLFTPTTILWDTKKNLD